MLHYFIHLGKFPFVLSLLLILNLPALSQRNNTQDSAQIYINMIYLANQNKNNNPESSYEDYKKCYTYFLREKNYEMLVVSLRGLSETAKTTGDYGLAFDHCWEGLYYAKEHNFLIQSSKFHRLMSYLYDMYNMQTEMHYHLNEALRISKLLYDTDDYAKIQHDICYNNLATRQRKLKNHELAITYLDSCILDPMILAKNKWFRSTYECERAKNLTGLGEIDLARNHLDSALKYMLKDDKNTPIKISSIEGELFAATGDFENAKIQYNKCIDLLNANNGDNLTKAWVLEQLSAIYLSENKWTRAYKTLEEANIIADSIQNFRLKQNESIFKINNKYVEAIQGQKEVIAEQKEIIKNKQQVQRRLIFTIAMLLLLGLSFILIIRTRLKLRKTLQDKKENELQAKLKEEQNSAVMDLKSKELTSYTLQLIDKETAINELLDMIKKGSPGSYKSAEAKFKHGSKNLWDEFNLRFTEVNSDFYKRLLEKHSNISSTEQKHCALIKLNFSVKEMAQILNIEPHSVNMSRSRIRKKMGLERSESLGKYIREL